MSKQPNKEDNVPMAVSPKTPNNNPEIAVGTTITPPQGEQLETVEIDLIQTPSEIANKEKEAATKFIARASIFNQEITAEEKATNVKKAYEGCLYIIGKRQLQSVEDDKTKREIFDMLLVKSKLKQSTVYKRIQFAQLLIDANIISSKMLARIEEEEKAESDLLNLLKKGLGGKKGIEIQQKVGYLPAPVTQKAKSLKSAKVALIEMEEILEAVLERIRTILRSPELQNEIKDQRELEVYRTAFHQMEIGTQTFKSFKALGDQPTTIDPEKMQLESIAHLPGHVVRMT